VSRRTGAAVAKVAGHKSASFQFQKQQLVLYIDYPTLRTM